MIPFPCELRYLVSVPKGHVLKEVSSITTVHIFTISTLVASIIGPPSPSE